MFRVLERRNRLRLALESRPPIRTSRRQHFDGDGAIESGVTRLVDLAHPSGPKSGDNLIRTEAGSRSQGHRRSGGL